MPAKMHMPSRAWPAPTEPFDVLIEMKTASCLEFFPVCVNLGNVWKRRPMAITIDIPGYRKLQLEHLVMDYNGTLAIDGQLIEGVKDALSRLSGQMMLHVVTADTFGRAAAGLDGIDCTLSILPAGKQAVSKRDYVTSLGADMTVAIGNGRNDRLMLEVAALGFAVILEEGAAAGTVMAADIICRTIGSALDLLTNPLRLTATLRA